MLNRMLKLLGTCWIFGDCKRNRLWTNKPTLCPHLSYRLQTTPKLCLELLYFTEIRRNLSAGLRIKLFKVCDVFPHRPPFVWTFSHRTCSDSSKVFKAKNTKYLPRRFGSPQSLPWFPCALLAWSFLLNFKLEVIKW